MAFQFLTISRCGPPPKLPSQATSFCLRLNPLPLPAYLHHRNGNSIKSILEPRNSFDSKNTKGQYCCRISVSPCSFLKFFACFLSIRVVSVSHHPCRLNPVCLNWRDIGTASSVYRRKHTLSNILIWCETTKYYPGLAFALRRKIIPSSPLRKNASLHIHSPSGLGTFRPRRR